MMIKPWITLLVCSTLAIYPSGVSASEIDIRTNRVRVSIGEDGEVSIINTDANRFETPAVRSYSSGYRDDRPDVYLRLPRSACRSTRDYSQSTRTSHANGNRIYSQSSVSTQVCQ